MVCWVLVVVVCLDLLDEPQEPDSYADLHAVDGLNGQDENTERDKVMVLNSQSKMKTTSKQNSFFSYGKMNI